ncbi:alpha/beta-hydrolase [Serendipita vermifera]|nr:alpha/beta-hydrolase [Serendipita vermifera]
MAVSPSDPHLLVAVQEDHTNPAPCDVVNALVTIDTNKHIVTPLVSGCDFYSSPTFSPDGKHLAWLQWTHPDMPWEGAELRVAKVSVTEGTLKVTEERHIDGEKDRIATNEPAWLDADTLLYLSDKSGFYNPYRYSVSSQNSKPILEQSVKDDFSEPAWQFGWSRLAVLNDTWALASPIHQGFSTLYLINVKTGKGSLLENPFTSISYLRKVSDCLVVMSAVGNESASALVQLEIQDQESANPKSTFKTLKETSNLVNTLPPGFVSASQAYVLKNGALHVIVTLPKNPDYTAPEGEKPPAVVNIHGGPTGRVAPGLSWTTQYFTSRGWAWVDVNYAGSAGFGREYRERLRGQWGVAEVNDAADSVKELGDRGLIDGNRATIRGGSAGGYTVLMTMCTPKTATVFAAGTSSYGVSDLTLLAHDTHKFESQYLFKLIGGTPKEVPDVYDARSPVKQAKHIKSPLLVSILQGSEDKVVPPNQAESIVQTIRANGGKVEYELYEGEGHGWRRADTVKRALERERGFYEQIFNLEPQ